MDKQIEKELDDLVLKVVCRYPSVHLSENERLKELLNKIDKRERRRYDAVLSCATVSWKYENGLSNHEGI